MINITLPDGSVKQFEKGASSMDVAKSISEGLARNVLSAKVNGEVWDADEKSPSMILFKDGNPVMRMYEETFYLDIVAKVGKFCD